MGGLTGQKKKGIKQRIIIRGYISQAKNITQVEPNDNLSATSFFRVVDPRRLSDNAEYDNNMYNLYQVRVFNIFWFNLELVRNIKGDPGLDYPFVDVLLNEILLIYQDLGDFKVVQIWEEPENVYQTYSLDHVKWQTDTWPYDCLALEMDMIYQENCF